MPYNVHQLFTDIKYSTVIPNSNTLWTAQLNMADYLLNTTSIKMGPAVIIGQANWMGHYPNG